MQAIISSKQQKELLTISALNRLNRANLASEIGLSKPTLRKILISRAPIIVNNQTYLRVNTWLSSQAKGDEQ
ncbi:hypothetical protein [Lactobacillus plantarum] [Lactiplantibacillus mudanjiangensis]|uniref:hypothetical protein n=1 Tax=Lactiplantibacillus mudanjiangensis TaxID=1296538 RepID=UPI001014E6BC|nr:hypothetical protein [Lactobacillus plantarum] [Lactiplantibacillus mudanjiangensis]